MNNNETWRLIKIARYDPEIRLTTGLQADLFDRLAERFPAYRTSERFINIDKPRDSAEIREFLDYLNKLVDKVPQRKGDYSNGITILDRRIISKEEVDAAQLLSCGSTGPHLAAGERHLDGLDTRWTVTVDKRLRNNLKREFGCLWPWGNVLLTRGTIKQKLEAAGLKHLIFRELPTAKGGYPDGVEPLFQLWSDFELPPGLNMLYDNDGNVFPSAGNRGPHRRGCFLLNGYEASPPPRYLRSEVDPAAFDVAITYERFGNGEPCWQQLIVSQKFRTVCKKLKIKLEWYPVIVE